MKRKILLIGGGGHCKTVLESIYTLNEYDDIGIIDMSENVGKTILKTKVIGTDADLSSLFQQGFKEAFITMGSIGDVTLRKKLTNITKNIGFTIPTIIDPSSLVSKYSDLERGVYIGRGAIINADSTIGEGSIINTGAIVEHDCEIGGFVHISPGSVICGEVKIGEKTHIGANTVIRQQVEIGFNTMVGMGSLVLNNIKSNVVAYGNPCKEVR